MDINGNNVNFRADKPTVLLKYLDRRGVVSEISSIFAKNDLNIASMEVTREKSTATMLCELDSNINQKVMDEISEIKDLLYKNSINPKSWNRSLRTLQQLVKKLFRRTLEK